MGQVAWTTEPSNVRRFRIVVVVHLAVITPTGLARLLLDLATLQINMRIRPRVHLESFDLRQNMIITPLPHVGVVTGEAVLVTSLVASTTCGTDAQSVAQQHVEMLMWKPKNAR